MSDPSPVAAAPPPGSGRRTACLLVLFGLWGLVAIARLLDVMVLDRDQYLADMSRDSVYRGVVPATRGRLLDRDGQPLAWSTRELVLVWRAPADPGQADAAWETLKENVPELGDAAACELPADPPNGTFVLRRQISPESFPILAAFCERHPGLVLEPRLRRHHVADPDLRSVLGEVRVTDGVEIGISGLEKTHDALLRARPGAFQVLLDKSGDWLLETWRKTRELRPGYDVHLPLRQRDFSGRS